ncbi:MAG: hypothetical protein ACQESH_07755 [Campylobacterota bacterium]
MSSKEQLFEGIKQSSISLFGVSYKRLFWLVVGVISLGVYLGLLLFGENSLTQYIKLQQQQEYYQQRVIELKEYNSKLQKDYFELKEVQPKE